jgi:hypothetical protein
LRAPSETLLSAGRVDYVVGVSIVRGRLPESTRVNAEAPQPARDYSRGNLGSRGRLGAPGTLFLAGLAGALLLVLSEFLTLFDVTALTSVVKTVKGHDQHNFALLVIGLAAALMALGAWRGVSRPAMFALAVLGAITAAIALIGDLPDVSGTSTLAKTYEQATADPGIGFYLETLGAALLLVSGVGQLLMGEPPPPPPPPPEEEGWAEAALGGESGS